MDSYPGTSGTPADRSELPLLGFVTGVGLSTLLWLVAVVSLWLLLATR